MVCMPTPLLKVYVAKSKAQKLGNIVVKIFFCAQLHDFKVFLPLFQEATSFQILMAHGINRSQISVRSCYSSSSKEHTRHPQKSLHSPPVFFLWVSSGVQLLLDTRADADLKQVSPRYLQAFWNNTSAFSQCFWQLSSINPTGLFSVSITKRKHRKAALEQEQFSFSLKTTCSLNIKDND